MDVLVLIEDEALRASPLKLVQNLRDGRRAVEFFLTPAKSDKQFKHTQELKTSFTVKLDSEEYARIRNLKTREEAVAGFADVANHLR